MLLHEHQRGGARWLLQFSSNSCRHVFQVSRLVTIAYTTGTRLCTKCDLLEVQLGGTGTWIAVEQLVGLGSDEDGSERLTEG